MTGPKCPNCTAHEPTRVDHNCGKWLCGNCDWLYDGGDLEWLRMTRRRDQYLALRKRLSQAADSPPEPVENFSTTTRRRKGV